MPQPFDIRANKFPAILAATAAMGGGGLAVASTVSAEKLHRPAAITRDIGAVPSPQPFEQSGFTLAALSAEESFGAADQTQIAGNGTSTSKVGTALTKKEWDASFKNCDTFLTVGSSTTHDSNSFSKLNKRTKIDREHGTAEATYYLRRKPNKYFKLCRAGVVATLNGNNERRKLKLQHKNKNGGDVTDRIVRGPKGFSILTIFLNESSSQSRK